MSTPELQSEAFTRAALRSERVRVIGLLWAFSVLALVVVARVLVANTTGELRLLPKMFGILGFMAAYEFLMLRFINRSIKTERQVQPGVWVGNVFIETLLPSGAIVLLAESGVFSPFQALVAPAGLTYFFFIILSTLRLTPALSRLTGVFAAGGYMLVTSYVYWQFPALSGGTDFTFPVYATYGVLILIGGFIAGAVAGQIRVHVGAALSEAETRRRMEHDLEIARSIQQGLLPSQSLAIDGFQITGWNKPADQTGGDYYDWQQLPDGRVAIIFADVTGHGIGAGACDRRVPGIWKGDGAIEAGPGRCHGAVERASGRGPPAGQAGYLRRSASRSSQSPDRAALSGARAFTLV